LGYGLFWAEKPVILPLSRKPDIFHFWCLGLWRHC